MHFRKFCNLFSTCSLHIFLVKSADELIITLLFTFPDCSTLNIRTDDLYLTRFFNVCNWNVTESYARLTKLFKLKVNKWNPGNSTCFTLCSLFQFEHPKWFSNKQLAEYREIMNNNAKILLAGRDKKGRRVYITKMCRKIEILIVLI